MLLLGEKTMEITRDTLKKYGKLAGIGVVGAGLGAGGLSYADNGPTQEKYKNLQDKVSDLNESNSDLQEELDNRPTQEVVDSLQEELDARPTQEVIEDLKEKVEQRDETISTMFTQEEVNDKVAREDVIEYLPVIADDAEISNLAFRENVDAEDHELDKTLDVVQQSDFDDDEFENEHFDEVTGEYVHDDGHTYNVTAVEFEDSEDADVYEDGLRDAVEDEEYDESLSEDAEVIRDGDTVVYVYGNADEQDYGSYDFDAVASQY